MMIETKAQQTKDRDRETSACLQLSDVVQPGTVMCKGNKTIYRKRNGFRFYVHLSLVMTRSRQTDKQVEDIKYVNLLTLFI